MPYNPRRVQPHPNEPALKRFESMIASLVVFALYAATLAPDVLWGDPTKLTLYLHESNVTLDQDAHVGTLAWSWLFAQLPFGTFVQKLHLSSAVATALATGLLHSTLRNANIGRAAAWIAVLAIAVAHTVWFVSVMIESYATSLLALSLMTWLLVVRRSTLGAGSVLGLSWIIHPLTLLSLPAIAIVLWQQPSGRRACLRFAVGLLAGAIVPLIVLPIVPGARPDSGLGWESVLSTYTSWSLPMRNTPYLFAYLIYNFVGPALLLIFFGWRRMSVKQRHAGWLLLVAHMGFGVFYLPSRAFLIPLPLYFAATYPIALGTDALLKRWRLSPWILAASVALTPPATYAAGAALLGVLGLPSIVRDAPFRNEATYYLQPWKFGENSARRYVECLGDKIGSGALVVGDFTILMPLHYAQKVEAWRPDITLWSVDHRSADEIVAHLQSALRYHRRLYLLDDEPGYHIRALRHLDKLQPVANMPSLQELVPGEK